MKKLLLILVLLPLLIFNNCTTRNENNILNPERSEAEIIAENLQKVIDQYKFSIAEVYVFNEKENTWEQKGGCSGYKVSSPFIKVCGTNYHLSKLVKYEATGSFKLYFKY